MFSVLNSIKDKVQSGVNKVTQTVQAQLQDLRAEQNELAKEEELDNQRKKEAKLPWEGLRRTNSQTNGSVTDIVRDEILELSKNESIFFTKEEDYIYEFQFDLEDYKYQAIKIQDYDKNLAEMRMRLVSKNKISDEQFWKNYFYHVEIIKMKHSVGAKNSSDNNVDDFGNNISTQIEMNIRSGEEEEEEDNI